MDSFYQLLKQVLHQIIHEDKNLFYRSLNRSLRDESIYIQAANYDLDEVDISIATTRFQSVTRPAGRAARIVSALSIDDVKKINVRSIAHASFTGIRVLMFKTAVLITHLIVLVLWTKEN